MENDDDDNDVGIVLSDRERERERERERAEGGRNRNGRGREEFGEQMNGAHREKRATRRRGHCTVVSAAPSRDGVRPVRDGAGE